MIESSVKCERFPPNDLGSKIELESPDFRDGCFLISGFCAKKQKKIKSGIGG